MMAGAIFAVGLAGIFSAFGTAGSQFEHQRHTTQGIHLAEAKMEELLLATSTDGLLIAGVVQGPVWFDVQGFASTAGCPGATGGVPESSQNCRYRITWESAPSLVSGVRILTVTAAWAEKGQTKSLAFSTQRN